MKQRNLILPLFLGSLFMPNNLDAAVFDLYKSNNNQKSDLLIASPGGHGGGKKTKAQQQKIDEAKEAAKKAAKQRIKNKVQEFEKIINKNGVINETLITELKKRVTPKIVSIFNDVKNDIKQIPELFIENETAPYNLQPFFRCVILTEKALEAEENGNLKKADIYAKLAIKAVVREKNILEKQGRQIKEKSIDPKSLENIEYSLLGINSIILDDYKSGSRYMKKALESENENTSNLKSLIAYTEIINGEIDQGCSDLEELIIDGTIDLVDLDIIPVEDICIKSRINK